MLQQQYHLLLFLLVSTLVAMTALGDPTATPKSETSDGDGPSTRDTNIYETTLELDQGAVRDGGVNPYDVHVPPVAGHGE
ncbi:hypothetical protein BGX24_008638 [Mortierella sp. AD032]|nr:hypothetical protein BGX24_008638 [Mortierella sp. AD032]